MKRIVKPALLLLMAHLTFKSGHSQDAHLSQYYVYPSWMNPAMTGVFDGDYRASAVYRSQWGNISKPYTTIGAALDVNTTRNVSLGINVLSQKAGDGGYNYTTAYGGVTYHGVRFGATENHRIAMGIQVGFIQKGFDPSKMTFGEGVEGFANTSIRSFDANAGILYYDAQPGKKANLFAGFSVSHITNPPQEKFIGTGNVEKEKLPIRYTAHGGVRIRISDQFTLTPNLLYLKQGTAEEKMVGAYGQYSVTAQSDVMVGVNYRFKDAFSPYVGFSYDQFVLGLSYDATTSDLSKMAKGSNAFEISLTFTGRKKVKTPETEFVCPRL